MKPRDLLVEIRRCFATEWPALMALNAALAVLLFAQARETKALWEALKKDEDTYLTASAPVLARHDHIFQMMNQLIALSATNAEAARIVNQFAISISDRPPAHAPPTAVSAPSLRP